MHDIEPHYLWRDTYVSSEDARSPHYGRVYDEFKFSNRVYNYYIHPQWDEFGSATLYAKIIYADYDDQTVIIELIGEWNDCLANDISILKQNVIDRLAEEGINRYILVMDHVLNFHGSDDCYYEEWFEDVSDSGGYIFMVNLLDHVFVEMRKTGIDAYVNMNKQLQIPNWRSYDPKGLISAVEAWSLQKSRRLY